MESRKVLVIGTGHLAKRISALAKEKGHDVTALPGEAFAPVFTFEEASRALGELGLPSFAMIYLVDDQDKRNLELLITITSLSAEARITASFFNEHIAPHLRAGHPHIRLLNPAKIAAPRFVEALDAPLTRVLRYTPAPIERGLARPRSDYLVLWAISAFAAMIVVASTYFHMVEGLAWLDAFYFVVMTVATVGYGDIALAHASALSKLLDIVLVVCSTAFIWVIFSLTIDHLIKNRAQLSLGHKTYSYAGHVVLCGLGRLGYFVAEGLLDRGERVVVIEDNESNPSIEHLRGRGADVYIGDARLPVVLETVGISRAKALFSLINDDYANVEIGLNARSFAPEIRVVLRIFDDAMSQKIKGHLDIQLTYSMTALVDETFLATMPS